MNLAFCYTYSFFSILAPAVAFVPTLEEQITWSSFERWLHQENLEFVGLTQDKHGRTLNTAIYDTAPNDVFLPIALFTHGEPTWQYLWREIIPFIAGCSEANYPGVSPRDDPWCRFGEMEPVGRVIGFDYIGFGQSDIPESLLDYEFRIRDHVAQMEAVMTYKGFIAPGDCAEASVCHCVEETCPGYGWSKARKTCRMGGRTSARELRDGNCSERRKITAVTHDWGAGITQGFMSRNSIINSLVTAEGSTFSNTFPPYGSAFFGELGEFNGIETLIEQNMFVESYLASPDELGGIYGKAPFSGSLRTLTDNEMYMFRSPFPTPSKRWGIWAFPSELPMMSFEGWDPNGNTYVQGIPRDVADLMDGGLHELFENCLPTLFLNASPGLLGWRNIPGMVDGFSGCPNMTLTITDIGSGIHYYQVDEPYNIGCSLRNFFIDQHGLDSSLKLHTCPYV